MQSMEQAKQFDLPSTISAADGGHALDTEDIMSQMKDGTTIISLKYDGGILLGADGRSSNVSGQMLITDEAVLNQISCGNKLTDWAFCVGHVCGQQSL